MITAKPIAPGGEGRSTKVQGRGSGLQVQTEALFLHCFEIIGFIWIKLAHDSAQLPSASTGFVFITTSLQ